MHATVEQQKLDTQSSGPTFWEICIFTFMHRVRLEVECQINMRLQPIAA